MSRLIIDKYREAQRQYLERGEPLSRLRRQLPFQGSLGDANVKPPLKGEVAAQQPEGLQREAISFRGALGTRT